MALLLLAAPAPCGCVRNAEEPEEDLDVGTFPAEEDPAPADEPAPAEAAEDEEEDVGTFIGGIEEGAEVEREEGGEEIFTVVATPEQVEEEGITHLVEIRTKLKFKGNKVELRNPQLVPALVQDIKDIKEKHAGAKFVYCLHVGTSAGERIKTARPGFMEGRVKSLKDALAEAG